MEETTQEAPVTSEEPKEKKEQNTAMAVIAYIIFFIPLLTESKDDPYVKFHVKQGLVLFIVAVVVSILTANPFLMMIGWVLHLAILALAILGIVNAVNGKEEELPVIGQFASKFTF